MSVCIAGLVRIDCVHGEINSNSDRQLGRNGPQCQPCDVDAIDGEDSPLQSKRSSRFLDILFLHFITNKKKNKKI